MAWTKSPQALREYVRLPEELFGDARKRATWIRRSLDYAETVKTKPARRT
jgi:TfoX/Sxy family transcriptional regulator of competence genes